MRFLRRDAPADHAAAISGFWVWWAGAKDRIAAAHAAGTMPSLAPEVSAEVNRIDPRLAWEFGPGHEARHALVVSPEGNPEIRPIAIAWLAAAPPADAV